MTRLDRRAALVLLAGVALADSALRAQTGRVAPPSPAAPASGFRELRWDDLMPKDWDPLKNFRGLNMGMLSDGDPKVQGLLKELRESFDAAPVVQALNDTAAKLPGYVVPLEENAQGDLREFLLVPYFGACIHTPPPPANQIVHVSTTLAPVKNLRAMDVVWVSGTMRVKRIDTYMGVSAYHLEAASVVPYVTQQPKR
ncbi:MAG: DUF3299 domain-containing protein [Aquabacterium sp.]